jgi:selenocysteine lyase/cysteine desulfurase
MGVENILQREHELSSMFFNKLKGIKDLNILAAQHEDRLGVFSFYIDDLHYNLGVKLLNDRFGIQTRGGCSCAGTYGHYLLHVDYETSHELTQEISIGDLVRKPGWIRLSIHPTTTNEEMSLICKSLKALAMHHKEWANEYDYISSTNEFVHKSSTNTSDELPIKNWFEL